jgi:molybdopterin-guanine dinucleotide biosynthesis protein A
MPEEKIDWRIKVADAAEAIYKEASALKDFLSMFFDLSAGRLPQVERIASVVETVIERLNKVMSIAVIILQEISKEEVNWEKIKEVFPTREWLASIESALAHLDHNKQFRGIMPFYYGSLQEDYLNHIWNNFQYMLNIFSSELGHGDIHDKYMEALAPRPPTEEELEEEYKEATGKKVGDLPSLFENISRILMEEFGEKKGFSDYWEGVAEQFESALRTADVDKLRDVYRQVKRIFESLPEDKRQTYVDTFNQFFAAVRGYALPLLKFKLIRRLLGLE